MNNKLVRVNVQCVGHAGSLLQGAAFTHSLLQYTVYKQHHWLKNDFNLSYLREIVIGVANSICLFIIEFFLVYPNQFRFLECFSESDNHFMCDVYTSLIFGSKRAVDFQQRLKTKNVLSLFETHESKVRTNKLRTLILGSITLLKQ